MSHLDLILVKSIRSVSRFIYFFLVHVQLFQNHLLKKLSLPNYIAFAPLPKISWLYLWELFWALSSSLIHLSIFAPIPHCLGSCSFLVILKSGRISSPTLFSFNIVLAILSLLPLHKTSESVCWFYIVCHYVQNNLLVFWLGLHWLYILNWEEVTSWQYWVFLSINRE